MTRNDLEKWIVAIHSQEELDEVLEMLKIENKTTLSNFPMIIYQGQNESINISEIEEENLEKLSREKLERKTLWNFCNIKSGLAEKMRKNYIEG